ncbi:hypothetical protein ACJ72_08051 [Emergomyces africanus]|uniref:Uncharacterized protein n=1 Tax=Emergomyces africanus TaxID=1955775 RepID=A0A1B7NLJ4_9EURO|nr:hypothetical protein ACJ72_08051 [Emergomyces africanus]
MKLLKALITDITHSYKNTLIKSSQARVQIRTTLKKYQQQITETDDSDNISLEEEVLTSTDSQIK